VARVVIAHFAHHDVVDAEHDQVASHNDVVVVPVIVMHGLEQFFRIAHGAGVFAFAFLGVEDFSAALGELFAEEVFVLFHFVAASGFLTSRGITVLAVKQALFPSWLSRMGW
jgi:predicted phage tail protein